jgi:fructokinase
VVFGVILGTGVGGGIVIDGKVLVGANAIAGEAVRSEANA